MELLFDKIHFASRTRHVKPDVLSLGNNLKRNVFLGRQERPETVVGEAVEARKQLLGRVYFDLVIARHGDLQKDVVKAALFAVAVLPEKKCNVRQEGKTGQKHHHEEEAYRKHFQAIGEIEQLIRHGLRISNMKYQIVN